VDLEIPERSLVVLVGPPGCGKSTFAARSFRPTEVLSSDAFRAMIADDPADLGATPGAFELLHAVAARRLAAGRLTVVDATNVRPLARRPLMALARRYHRTPVAIVFDLPEEVCQERNRLRGRVVPAGAVHRHAERLRGSLGLLEGEGFEVVHVLRAPDEVDRARVVRVPGSRPEP
jgi:protein phosphatase